MTWTGGQLDLMRSVGDRLADDTVAAIFERGDLAAVHSMMRTLVHNDQLVPDAFPEEVRSYLERDPLPAGVDMARVERAQDFFQLWGVQISLSLFCASLPSAYAAAKGVKVLYETARLQTDTRRRILETGQFLMDVMAPGGLAPGGKGIRSIQRVRLMHAAVRRLLLTDGTWDTAAWGVPINQEDLAGTMLSFSYVPCEPLRRLGVDVSDQDAEDYIACWNVVGEMLGVLPEMRPAGVAEATELVGLIRARHDRPSPEGAVMTAALVDLLEQMTPHLGHRRSGPAHIRGLGRLVPVTIRHLIGDDVAEMISVPPARPGWFRILEPLLVLIRAVESGVERDRHLHTVVEPLGRALLEGSFAIERGGVRAPFDIPDHLARRWELSS